MEHPYSTCIDLINIIEHPTEMIRTISILLIWMIGDCKILLCQIIPYQYLTSEESTVSQYADYDKSISLSISNSLNEYIIKAENRLMDTHKSATLHMLDMIANHSDSIDINYFMQELNQSRVDLQDSLSSLLPLRLQSEQLQFIAERKVWLPVRSSLHAKMFFSLDGSGSDAKLMSHNFFSYNTKSQQLALYSELFSDYFGPVRFGFGALMTNGQLEGEQNETVVPESIMNQDALQRLLNGGGNSIISLAYPLLQWRDVSWTRGLRILAVPKYALDIPAIGSSVEDYSANGDIGIEASAHWSGNNQNIAVFFQSRVGYIMGNSAFEESIQSKNNFYVTQLNFGIAFRNTIKLSYSIYNISDDDIAKNLPGFISFSLIPQY